MSAGDGPGLPIVILPGCASSHNAVATLKFGAFDFILKRLDHHLATLALHRRAVRHRRDALATKRELERLRTQVAALRAQRSG